MRMPSRRHRRHVRGERSMPFLLRILHRAMSSLFGRSLGMTRAYEAWGPCSWTLTEGVHEVWNCTLLSVHRRAAEDDGLVPLRARVQPEILDALQLEAMTRRVSPGRLLIELLAEFLPMAAAERVRR